MKNPGQGAGKEMLILFSINELAWTTPDNKRLRSFSKISPELRETKAANLCLTRANWLSLGCIITELPKNRDFILDNKPSLTIGITESIIF